MRRIIITAALFLVSHSALAEAVSTIRIFLNDSITVTNDLRENVRISIAVYNMDLMEKTEQKLTNLVRSKVPANLAVNDIPNAYKEAFSEVLNGPQWKEIYYEIETSSAPVEYALRYKIKKLPAIVINDKYILYGVTSLAESIKHYQSYGG
jgi:hypothetical protein